MRLVEFLTRFTGLPPSIVTLEGNRTFGEIKEGLDLLQLKFHNVTSPAVLDESGRSLKIVDNFVITKLR